MWLDEELEPLWLDPADTPAWKRGSMDGVVVLGADDSVEEHVEAEAIPAVGSPESRAAAAVALDALRAMHEVLHRDEDELGRIDAIAGDGDHGRGMVRGIDYAVAGDRVDASQFILVPVE